MRTSIKTLLLLGTAATGAPAFAGGIAPVVEEPAPVAEYIAPPAIVTDWSGVYGGLSYSKSGGSLESGGIEADFNDGTAPGAFAGYNFQRGNLVYGGELAYQKFNDTTLEGDDTTQINDSIDLKGRVGYAAGKALMYGTLGYSMASVDIAGSDESFSGVNYGLGVDYLVTDNVFVGAEYSQRNLSGKDAADGIDVDASTLGLKVGFKF